MKKKNILLCFMALLVSVLVTIVSINKTKISAEVETTRSILAGDVDVQCALDSTFESYGMNTLDNQIQFTGNMSIDKTLDADYNALSDYDDSYDVTISANYDYDTHIMYISYFVYENDALIDSNTLMGTPFVDDEGNADVVFYDEGETIFLSELDVQDAVNECGFFSFFRKIASACAEAVKVIAPVCIAVSAVAAVVAVSCVTCGVGGVAILGTTVAVSTIAAAGATVAAIPLVIGGIAIASEVVADFGEGLLAMSQSAKSKIDSVDDLLDKGNIPSKLKDLGKTKAELKKLLAWMLGLQGAYELYKLEKSSDKVLVIGRDLTDQGRSYEGATSYDFSHSYEKLGHWAFYNINYQNYVDEFGYGLMQLANYCVVFYCICNDWDFLLATHPYYYIAEHKSEMIECAYANEIALIRSNSYNYFTNTSYTWGTFTKPTSCWAYGGYRVSR